MRHTAIATAIRYEWHVGIRSPNDWLTALLFFIMAVSLYPFAIGPEPTLLGRIGSGVVLTIVIFAGLLAASRLFVYDVRDGTALQIVVSGFSSLAYVWSKIIVHWMVTGIPLLCFFPIYALLFHIDSTVLFATVGAVFFITAMMSIIGTTGAVLTIGSGGGGFALLTVLVLPLLVPALIFSVGTIEAVRSGLPIDGTVSACLALLLLSATVCPMIAAKALYYLIDS